PDPPPLQQRRHPARQGTSSRDGRWAVVGPSPLGLPVPCPAGGGMRRELGGFLQQRRRHLGLRREEVAAQASVGYDWYVRMQQGRGRASSDVLRRVWKVLELVTAS